MAKIKVIPTHPNVLNVSHPVDGKLKADGGWWENDSFTARMLSDGAVKEAVEETVQEKAEEPVAEENPVAEDPRPSKKS